MKDAEKFAKLGTGILSSSWHSEIKFLINWQHFETASTSPTHFDIYVFNYSESSHSFNSWTEQSMFSQRVTVGSKRVDDKSLPMALQEVNMFPKNTNIWAKSWIVTKCAKRMRWLFVIFYSAIFCHYQTKCDKRPFANLTIIDISIIKLDRTCSSLFTTSLPN